MEGNKIGYARTSTLEQVAGLESQIRELNAAGCIKLYKEQVSATGKRPKLREAIDYLRSGEVLTVTKLDRLARSTNHLGEIVEELKKKGAYLHVLNLNMDTSTATGRLILDIMGSIGQFEKDMMLERQREGIAKAKAEGKYKGRKKTAQAKSDDVLRLRKEGLGPTEIYKKLGISRSSVYRILNDTENAKSK